MQSIIYVMIIAQTNILITILGITAKHATILAKTVMEVHLQLHAISVIQLREESSTRLIKLVFAKQLGGIKLE